MATDLVCGMQVDERTAASSVFEGRSYFFCCAGCKKKFDASPFTYVGAPRHAGKAVHSGHAPRYVRTANETPGNVHQQPVAAGAATPGASYTCPMHPEIVRNSPGECPLCGMALVPSARMGGGEIDDSELHDLTRRLWVGVELSIPLVVLAMSPMIGIHALKYERKIADHGVFIRREGIDPPEIADWSWESR